MNHKNITKQLIEFIDNSPSVFHVIANIEDILNKNGFKRLEKGTRWKLESSNGYYLTNNESSVIAFRVGNEEPFNFNIIGSHSDSPTFKIKPNPVITTNNHFIKLNIETYGGPIISTWLDRPLSLAGRVIIKEESGKLVQQNINLDKDLLIIPNIAIHMNKELNDGYVYNVQKDMLPLIGLVTETLEKDNYLLSLLSEQLKTEIDNILDFDLYLYDRQNGCIIGQSDDMYSVGKIDNLGNAFISIESLINSQTSKQTQIVAIFDNEEIGSCTKQGAGSTFLRDTLERIVHSLGGNKEDFYIGISNSFIISSDQAHSLHPNYVDKNDITNLPLINNGPVIKVSSNMRYTTDAMSSQKFVELCKKSNVPYQFFVNRSDMRGGSTIGPIISNNLDIESVDIGNPILSMHSIRELGGTKDNDYLYKVFLEFFK